MPQNKPFNFIFRYLCQKNHLAVSIVFKTLARLWRRRKAISPVIATILIIALTVSAAAIVYFVVVPLLKGDGELVVLDYELEDTDASDLADKLTISVQNIGTAIATINGMSILRDGVAINWTLGSSEYEISASEQMDIICKASGALDELKYGQSAIFTINFDKKSFSITLRVPAKFSQYVLLYDEDFEDFVSVNWSLTIFQTHNPAGTQTLADWVINEQSGNHYWRCTSNNCQFIVLEDPMRDFADVNITYDLRTDDNDANGIIYRYDNSGPYPNFYIVWFTRDHPSPTNGPHSQEITDFDWDTPADQIQQNKVTIHYVEGDADGFNWYKLAEADWTRNNNQWYTWRVVADGADMDLYIDNMDTPFMSYSDARITHGYIGFVSFANANSHYDNIYVWQQVE
ncbi:MAG: hypothetical protein FK733_18285 [Asgard group archaeon]|nr:hypothetical protein [Asgard group archaeon]